MARRISQLVLLVALLGPSSKAADVHVVGPGFLANVQTAVDLAVDGDIILVKPGGPVSSFTVDGKSLSVVADSAAPISLFAGTVRNLPSTGTVVIAGFRFQGCLSSATFTCSNSLGSVRVQACTIGAAACTGAFVTDCPDLSFSDCTISASTGTLLGASRGLTSVNSSVTLHLTTVLGGSGLRTTVGGFPVIFPPASGALIDGGALFVGGGLIQGGRGVPGVDGTCGTAFPPTAGGAGATGLELLGPTVNHMDAVLAGGLGGEGGFGGGTCFAPDGPAGAPFSGSGPVFGLPGQQRRLEAARPVRELGSQPLVVHGVPGDRAYLALSGRTDRVLELALSGVVLFKQPARRLFLGTIDGTGTLSVSLPVPELGPGVDARRWFTQLIVLDAGNQLWLGSPSCLTFLDSSF